MHDRDHGYARSRQARHVGEGRAAAHEHLRLKQEVGPGALDELDVGQLLAEGDLLGADRLLDAHRMRGAALDPGIVGRDEAAHARDEADAGDQPAAVDVVLAVVLVHAEAAKRRQLKKGRIAVEKPVDPLPRRQLPAGAELVVGPGRGGAHLALEVAELGDQLQMRQAIGAKRLAFHDDVRRDRRHAVAPPPDARPLRAIVHI